MTNTNTPREWQHSAPREVVPGVYGQGQGLSTYTLDQTRMMHADPIVAANVSALLQRSRVGLKKYGCTLEGLSVRAGLEHALEEALDLANYLRAVLVRMEDSPIEAMIRAAGNFLMTKTSLPVETIVDLEDAMRAAAPLMKIDKE